MTKPEKTISDEFYSCVDKNKSKFANLNWLGKLRMKNRETGAYEASDKLLGNPFYYCSESFKFINTMPQEQRTRCPEKFQRYNGVG